MDFESVRVSYCCKTVSRSNFWRKDFIVKMSLFVYTNDIFQILLIDLVCIFYLKVAAAVITVPLLTDFLTEDSPETD